MFVCYAHNSYYLFCLIIVVHLIIACLMIMKMIFVLFTMNVFVKRGVEQSRRQRNGVLFVCIGESCLDFFLIRVVVVCVCESE